MCAATTSGMLASDTLCRNQEIRRQIAKAALKLGDLETASSYLHCLGQHGPENIHDKILQLQVAAKSGNMQVWLLFVICVPITISTGSRGYWLPLLLPPPPSPPPLLIPGNAQETRSILTALSKKSAGVPDVMAEAFVLACEAAHANGWRYTEEEAEEEEGETGQQQQGRRRRQQQQQQQQ